MADIKAGDPETLKSDSRAYQEWQDKAPASADLAFAALVDARAARQAQILEFEKEQSRHGGVSLGVAVEWLEECNKELLTKRVNQLWKALSGETSTFRIGGDLLPSATIVQEDSSPPMETFDAADVAAVLKSPMYRDPQVLRALIERLWVPRDVLLKLFQEKPWPIAPWLEAPPAPIAEIIPSNSAAVSPENSEEEPAKSGLPGRPTSRSLYLAKLNERAETGEVADTLKAEAEFLFRWLKTTHPTYPSSGTSAIRNMIREDYNRSKKPKIESPTAN
jgi:hypothetical protein